VFDYTFERGEVVANRADWRKEFNETKELLDRLQEKHFKSIYNYRGGLWENAKANAMNAHYTDVKIVSAVYQALEQMGYRTGNLPEPQWEPVIFWHVAS
jgi:hypothetical protein